MFENDTRQENRLFKMGEERFGGKRDGRQWVVRWRAITVANHKNTGGKETK